MFKFFAENDGDDSGIDKKGYLALRFFILILPNIADIILTILSYDKDYKTYYIVRYVFQLFDIICCFMFAWIISYNIDCDDTDECTDCTIFSYFIMPFLAIVKEIPSLVFFIMDFDNLALLSKIGYFSHLISSLFIIIFFIVIGFQICFCG